MTLSKAAEAVAIVQADAEGTIRLWSEGAETLLGHSAAQAIGKTLDLLVPQSYRAQHWSGFRSAIARGGLNGNEPFILPIVCADGKTKHFAGRLTMLLDAYGRAAGALAVFVPENTSPDAPKLFRLD